MRECYSDGMQNHTASFPAYSWFKALRNDEALELIAANANAFVLLYVIAYRAQWSNKFNRHGLDPGEALLGDFKTLGMSEQNYRTAKQVLRRFQFATFRPTPRGTVAKLLDARIFDLCLAPANEPANKQPTNIPRPANGQPTTTYDLKTSKTAKNITSMTRFETGTINF